jgi:diacylglycerol kinase (ATP)
MKVAALLSPGVDPRRIEPFRLNSQIEIVQTDTITGSFQAALIFGGDGTMHRHLPRLRETGIPALVVPSGSGNDFAHALGIHNQKDALRAWKQFCSKGTNVKAIDLGLIVKDQQETLFCCIAGAGLDSEANARANRLPLWLRGTAGYLISALRGLASFRPVEIEVITEEHREKSAALLVAIANAPRYGGGIRIAPQAQLDDGQFDICLVRKLSIPKVLIWAPTTYFGGHTRLREVAYFRTRSIGIRTSRPLDLYADGEFICQTPVEIGLLAHTLNVIVSAGGV